MERLILLNPEHATEDDVASYEIRNASRAVVIDHEKHVALLHVTNRNHYILPGGKIEKGEDRETALRRECLEEIGCEVEILAELGMVEEYRKMFAMHQTSYGYFARVVGEKGKPQFTKSEQEKGFVPVWLPYEQALRVLEESQPTVLQAKLYIAPRDLILLKEAKLYVQKY